MIKRIHSTLLLCKDIDQTTQFYKQIGFTVEALGHTSRINFGDYRLTFIDESRSAIKDDLDLKKGVGIFIFFEVENVNSFYETLRGNSISILGKLEERQGGKRRFTVQDPDGYKLVFFTKTQKL